MRLFLAAAAASLCALAGEAGAQTFAASAVRIDHAAAVVTVIPEERADINVSISPGDRVPTPTARLTSDGVVIDGGLRDRIRGCAAFDLGGARGRVRIAGIGNVRREELPRITIRTPRALDLAIGGAVFTSVGASAGGAVAFNGCGDATMSFASGALDVALNGSGDVDVGRVAGALAATLNGSGSLSIERAGANAALRLNGSGDLRVGAVAGQLDARLAGSGSLQAASAGGDSRLALHGSGDVEAGAIAGSLDAELRGSGSVSVASVEGASASLDLFSSGDLVVRSGRVEQLSVSNSGSGEVSFGGAAASTRAMLSGSGDISVAHAGRIEQLVDRGSGSVSLGR